MTAAQQPDPEQLELLRSTRVPSDVHDVARAIEVALTHYSEIYVERTRDGWRWSFVTDGGPYPLWRMVAQFLRVDHRRILVGAREVGGRSVVDPETPDVVAHWYSFVTFASGTASDAIAHGLELAYAEWLAMAQANQARRNGRDA